VERQIIRKIKKEYLSLFQKAIAIVAVANNNRVA